MIACVGLTILIGLSLAQLVFGQSSSAVVKAQGYTSVDGVKPESKFKIAIGAHVASGYHINARVPTEDYLIATNVKFEPLAGLKIAAAKYPKPQLKKFEFSDKELAVLEGKVFIIVDAEAEKNIQPGAQTIKAIVTLQSCNDKQCLAPADIKVGSRLPSWQLRKPLNLQMPMSSPKRQHSPLMTRQLLQPRAMRKPMRRRHFTQFKGNEKTNDIANSIENMGCLSRSWGFSGQVCCSILPPVFIRLFRLRLAFLPTRERRKGKSLT